MSLPESASPSRPASVADDGRELSIVVPFYDEAESAEWVLREVLGLYPASELIGVDDGSSDGTWRILGGLEGVCALRLSSHTGQSAAIYTGLRAATRAVCVLMDGDGQNDPADIVALVAALDGADVACGVRVRRQDTLSKRLAARVANTVRRAFLADGVRDTGCSLKAFDRRHVEHLVPFDSLHRFLPAVFRAAGLRIVEIDVNHRPRRFGVSKYGNLSRAVRGIYDLVGVAWLLRRKIRFPATETGHERSSV